MIPIKSLLLFGLLFGILSLAVSFSYSDILKEEWNEFKALYQKVYAEDEQFRMGVFAKVGFIF